MVLQSSEKDCGKTTVRNALCTVFHRQAFCQAAIREPCNSFGSMIRALETLGVQYAGYAVDIQHLMATDKRAFPIIAQVMNGQFTHFVLILSIRHKHVDVMDPQFGRLRLRADEFASVYLGKALLKEKILFRPKPKSCQLVTIREKGLYSVAFLMQSLSLIFMIRAISNHLWWVTVLSWLVVSLCGVSVQLILNLAVRKRLEEEVMIPYLENADLAKDFPTFEELIQKEVKTCSFSVTSAVTMVTVFVMLCQNGLLILILALLSLVVGFACFHGGRYQNRTNRTCSLEESSMILGSGCSSEGVVSLTKEGRLHFENSRKAAQRFERDMVLAGGCFLMMAVAIIYSALKEQDLLSFNAFLFYLGMTMALTKGTYQLLCLSRQSEERDRLLNRLSVSLGDFLLKKRTSLGYNTKH